MNSQGYFFDSYAIIEILNGHEQYLNYEGDALITNTLNVAETYYHLLQLHDEKTAEAFLNQLSFSFIEITKEIAIEASRFRYRNKKLKISYADSIGYVTALKYNLKFLTGDRMFEKMSNVEFVK